MASFESKVSDIFDENPRLSRKVPVAIRQIFNVSEADFKKQLRSESEDKVQAKLSCLFGILFIDFHFDELGGRFLDWVINHYSGRFSESELEEMRAQSEAYLDFYEIQQVFPGEGSIVKSLFTDREGFLKDVSSSLKLVKWDIVLLRCYYFRDSYYSTGSLSLFIPPNKKYIIDRMSELRKEYENQDGQTSYPEFAKNHWQAFFKIESEIREKAINKKLYTKYGELQLCEVRFRVRDFHQVLDKIENCEEFNFIEVQKRRDSQTKKDVSRYRFDWFTLGIEKELESIRTKNNDDGVVFSTTQLDIKGNQLGIDVIGCFYVDQYLARLETNSLELANFAVCHFNQLFGDALTFKKIAKRSIPKVNDNEVPNREKLSEPPPPKVARRATQQIYLSLLNGKVPILHNKSPREARRDPKMIPLLIDWLKSLENSLERNSLTDDNQSILKKIKKELDIDW